jgi:hypothetical protein
MDKPALDATRHRYQTHGLETLAVAMRCVGQPGVPALHALVEVLLAESPALA